MAGRVPYVCGPLTELPLDQQSIVKEFYRRIADVCEEVIGQRAFVPHEHYDPIQMPQFSTQQVYVAERKQVCEKSSLLIVVTIAPSWGGGIEVEMANQSGIPVVLLCEEQKLQNRLISRLLRGNPAVKEIISYTSESDALEKLKFFLKNSLP